MAHFAEIDQNNVVLRVIVVSDTLEAQGAEWCHDTFGGNWLQTSYNGRIRKNFAGIGFTYDPDLDAFVPPKPYPSWVLIQATAQWKAPKPRPTVGLHQWNEATQEWDEVAEEPQP